MTMIRLEYTGRKFYKDRTPVRNEWNPGDVKLVTAINGKALLKFAEFKVFTPDAETAAKNGTEKPAKTPKDSDVSELEQAKLDAEASALAASNEQALNEKESMLLAVESWDKDMLKEYAGKYDTKLDGRSAVAAQRAEVSNLIEQFGVR